MSPQPLAVTCLVSFLAMAASSGTPARAETVLSVSPRPSPKPFTRLLLGTQTEFHETSVSAKMADPGFLQAARDARFGCLRFPGGTPALWYIWDEPSASYRPFGEDSQLITLPGFIKLCADIGAEPILQVNSMRYGPGQWAEGMINPADPSEVARGAAWAGRWVRQTRRSGAAVSFWEIGNEDWTFRTAAEYAALVAAYSQAMRRADRRIRIIATGLTGETGPWSATWLEEAHRPKWWEARLEIRNSARVWTEALCALPAGTWEYLAPHLYFGSARTDAADNLRETMAQLASDTSLSGLNAMLDEMRPEARLAITEWAVNFGHSTAAGGSRSGPYYTLATGLATADLLGRLVSAERVEIAVQHALTGMGTLWTQEGFVREPLPLKHPTWLAQQLWALSEPGDGVLDVRLENPPTYAVDGQSVPYVTAYGTGSERRLTLIIINTQPHRACHIRLALPSAPREATASLLTGPSLDATNWGSLQTGEYAVRIVEQPAPLEGRRPVFRMSPRSAVALRLQF